MKKLLKNNKFVYLLGFLWGDGGVSKKGSVTLWIVKKDSLIVQDIIRGVVPFRVYKYQSKSGNRQPVEAIVFKNDLRDFLIENDYLTKSYATPTKILSIIPENLKHYFWRGYSDADGCFYKRKGGVGGAYSLAGSYSKNWNEEVSLLKSLGIYNYRIDKKIHKKLGHKSSVLYFRHNREIKLFGEYVYKGEFFGLERKFKKFEEILSKEDFRGKYAGVSFQPNHVGPRKWRVYFKGYIGRYETEEEGLQAKLKAQASYEARKK